MATSTVSHETQKSEQTLDDAAHELFKLLEEHFDELGLNETERDRRYAAAEAHVIEKDAVHGKASA